MATGQKPPRKQVRWKPIFLVHIYRMLRLGIEEVPMCQSLGFSRKTFWVWQQEKPELAECVALARKEYGESQDFPSWVYNKLSPELKKLWDKIKVFEKEPNGIAKIELMLQDNGKRVRQQLFLHALVVNRFSPSAAMSKVNVGKKEFDSWLRNDVDFALLVDEIQWHKGNFFEECLINLVSEGNPAAVLFANKTFNRTRGYGDRRQLDVYHSGGVDVNVGVVDLSEIMCDLSHSAKMELLEAIRAKDAKENPRLSVQEKISDDIIVVAKGEGVPTRDSAKQASDNLEPEKE